MPKEPEEKKTITLSLDLWICEQINDIAERERRSMSMVVNFLLEAALKSRKKNEPLAIAQ